MSLVTGVQPARGAQLHRSLVAALRRFPSHLRDPGFWLIQGVVLAVTALHITLEAFGHSPLVTAFHHVPAILYVIPVVWASLSFGWEGGALTGAWSALLTVPNLALFHRADFGWAGELTEIVMVIVVGVTLGRQVERERHSRQELQHYASQLTRAQEEERLRVARDLHDDTLQSLVLIGRALDRTMAECQHDPTVSQSTALSTLHLVRQQVQAAADDLRRFAAELRPAMLDDLGLAASLQWLFRDVGARLEIETALRITGTPRRLNRETEVLVFRIAQEGLRNVEKHARACRVDGWLDFADAGVRLQIGDDGVGFDPGEVAQPSSRPHLGLTGMRERARLAGGELTVASQPGQGTRLALSVPG